jgi:hypothetical protein
MRLRFSARDGASELSGAFSDSTSRRGTNWKDLLTVFTGKKLCERRNVDMEWDNKARFEFTKVLAFVFF